MARPEVTSHIQTSAIDRSQKQDHHTILKTNQTQLRKIIKNQQRQQQEIKEQEQREEDI